MSTYDPGLHAHSFISEGGVQGIGEAVYKPRSVDEAMNAVLSAVKGGAVETKAEGSHIVRTKSYGVVTIKYDGNPECVSKEAVAKAFDLPLGHENDISHTIE